MAQITVNEGLAWMKTLRARQAELVGLRDANSYESRRFIAHTDKEVEKKPTYDVKELDKLISGVARDIRKLDTALKRSNAVTLLADYDQNDEVLGELK